MFTFGAGRPGWIISVMILDDDTRTEFAHEWHMNRSIVDGAAA